MRSKRPSAALILICLSAPMPESSTSAGMACILFRMWNTIPDLQCSFGLKTTAHIRNCRKIPMGCDRRRLPKSGGVERSLKIQPIIEWGLSIMSHGIDCNANSFLLSSSAISIMLSSYDIKFAAELIGKAIRLFLPRPLSHRKRCHKFLPIRQTQ